MQNNPIFSSLTSAVQNLHVGAIILTVALVIFWINIFFIEYHLIRFGIGKGPKRLAMVSMAGSVALSIVAAVVYLNL